MKNMTAKYLGIAAMVFGFAVVAMSQSAYDTGVWLQKGQYSAFRKISLAATAGTLIWSADTQRPDSICRNNTAVTVWISSVTTTEAFSIGFPVLSSETVKLGGSYSGSIYGLCNSGTCDIRCWDGKVNL